MQLNPSPKLFHTNHILRSRYSATKYLTRYSAHFDNMFARKIRASPFLTLASSHLYLPISWLRGGQCAAVGVRTDIRDRALCIIRLLAPYIRILYSNG